MRYFKFVNHLTVPRTLRPGVGNTHVRPLPGNTLAIDDEACARESRFINGRIKAGDIVEIKEGAHSPGTCAYQKHVDLHAAHAAKVAESEAAPAEPAAKGK